MLGIHDFGLFILSGLLLNVTPGPDTAYIVGRSMQMGWRGGALAALGICTGCLVHVFAAAVGLSALLAASARAFLAVKWLGAAYLAYIGIRLLLTHRQSSAKGVKVVSPVVPLRTVFLQGALTNVLNPKVALFFLAFLPQFVAADAPQKPLAFLLLGGIFIANSTIWCLGVAAVAARTARRVQSSSQAVAWLNRAIGGLFVYLGIRIALLDAR
ncbi:putative amino acid efflux protein, LysE family [Bradyrhizobium sp. STM 3843]|uniref:LysE family translocator n=1 Tax=Bradyrhizobium sp. STM 3843 TaxID=551947 RepID=UPI00024077C4|nr:LysE family translocator [Bradyrhizobium sp. STM 3843]CCE07397.1 putative amino acid efflux protein, LysE family [Bradyrhizobium sp. STM 3843]